MNKKVAIVYHSGYGHTVRVAQAIAQGVGAHAQLIAIDAQGDVPEQAWETLQTADAIVLGSPTYMGGPSWQFKKFADASSKAWFTRAWQDKFFAGFTNSASLNGDKFSTLAYFQTLAAQHGGLWISLGIAPANNKAAKRDDINNLGGSAGLLVQTPADASPTEMVEGDLQTARQFGERIAKIVNR